MRAGPRSSRYVALGGDVEKLPESVPLFRREAVIHRADALFGSVLIPQSRLLGMLSFAAVLLVIAVFAVLVTGQYTRRFTATGWLVYEPGDAKITSTRSGTVSQIWASEGSDVAEGDPLITISTGRSTASATDVDQLLLDDLAHERSSIARQLAAEKALGIENTDEIGRSIETLRDELERLKAQRSLAARRAELALAESERMVRLSAQGLVARVASDKAQDGALAAQMALNELDAQIADAGERLQQRQAEQRNAPLRSRQRIAELEAAVLRLDQRITDVRSQRELVLRAPIRGTVGAVPIHPGDTVVPGVELMVIVPHDATLQAELYIPTRAAGFVDEGKRVRMRYAAFPYQKFGHFDGTIWQIDRSLQNPNARNLPASLTEPSYRVSVTLTQQFVEVNGRGVPLRAGMTLQADVQLDERRFIEWLIGPVLAAMSRV
jgi:membrane fusion protein